MQPLNRLWRLSGCALSAGIALVAVCSWGQAGPGEGPTAWSGYRGPQRDGVFAETSWEVWGATGPKKLWSAQVGAGYSALTVFHGRAYTAGHRGSQDIIYCFDAETGEEIWTHPYNCSGDRGGYRGPRGTPSVDGKYVFSVSMEGDLLCLAAKTGELVWSKQAKKDFGCEVPTWGCANSPLLLNDLAIYDLGKIIALEKATGKVVWETANYGPGYSSVMAFQKDGRTLIAAFPASGLVVLDAADGKVIGQLKWKTQYDINAVIPIIYEGDVFISSGYNKGCALVRVVPAGLQVLWDNRNMRNHVNTCVRRDGYVYGFDGQVGGGG